MTRSYFFGVLCLFMLIASTAAAQSFKDLGSHDGVDVMAAIDPLGPNNLVAASVKFVNSNTYKVNVKWTPLLTCGDDEAKRKGFGADFSLDAGATYEVKLWRSGACGPQEIRDLGVEMEATKADLY